MQNDGGKLMILISEDYTAIDKFQTLDYDSSEFIGIPSIVIRADDATNLVGVNKLFDYKGIAIELEANFEAKQSWDTVQLEFWFQTIDYRAISFIKDFKNFRDGLGSRINFIPHYLTRKKNEFENLNYGINTYFYQQFDYNGKCLCWTKY